MALNIPMPDLPGNALLKGLDTGSTLFSRLMQPVIERERMKQQHEEFLQAHAMDGIRRKIFEQQLLGLQNKNDPNYKFNQYRKMIEAFSGGGSNQDSESEQLPDLFGGQSPRVNLIPKNRMGLNLDATGNLMHSDLNEMPNVPEMPKIKNTQPQGMNFDVLRQNPILRGFFKHEFGFDPLAEDKYEGPARNAVDLDRVKKQYGEDSEVYQNAKADYDAQVDQKRDLRDLRDRTKRGLKPGEKEFFDENTNEPLGKEIPLTAKERESEQGNIMFNELYPYVYKGASPFSGEGSISRLQQAAANYKTDPKARKMLDDFLLAEKMLAATTVNEAATLKSGHQNRTYSMLKDSLDAQDVPRVIKKLIKEYNLPASAQLKAAMRYQKILSDARKKSVRKTPATQKLFYDPEKQARHQQEMDEGNTESSPNEVIVIDPQGKRYKTTEDNAAHLPEGWSRG